LREENVAGGLLFTPDTKQIRVSNHNYSFIWNLSYGAHDRQDILKSLKAHCGDVVENTLVDHLDEFPNDLLI
jgi:hypothetical protein